MKIIRTTIIVTLLLYFVIALASCESKQAYVDLCGGSLSGASNASFSEIVKMVPTREGYAFLGWYADAAYSEQIDPYDLTKEQKSKARAYAKWTNIAAYTYHVRSNEVTVTDSGRENQSLDSIYLENEFNMTDLYSAGYVKLRVTVTMEMTEVDNGYQHVFLYRTSSLPDKGLSLDGILDEYVFGEAEETDPNLLHSHQYEFGGGDLNSEWGNMTYTTTISTNQLNQDLYVRYGASGKDGDTWKNKNVQVTIEPVRP